MSDTLSVIFLAIALASFAIQSEMLIMPRQDRHPKAAMILAIVPWVFLMAVAVVLSSDWLTIVSVAIGIILLIFLAYISRKRSQPDAVEEDQTTEREDADL